MSERTWRIDDRGAALEILAPDGTSICMVHNTDRPDDEYGDPAPETLANAYLLTASPSLLGALRELLEYADNGAPVYPGALIWDDVRAAIASATGKDFRVSERTAGTYYNVNENVYSHETKQEVAYCFSTADATFLAAAPDMMKALELINDVITRQWLDSEPGFESDPDDLLRDCTAIARRAIARATPEHRRER